MHNTDRPFLSRGSPSQLTLLVNTNCSQVYTANHVYCDWRFFFLKPDDIHVAARLISFSALAVTTRLSWTNRPSGADQPCLGLNPALYPVDV